MINNVPVEITYGYDMITQGYFFNATALIEGEHPADLDITFETGLTRNLMLNLLTRYKCDPEHIAAVILDLPF